jgi:hypothetical protein
MAGGRADTLLKRIVTKARRGYRGDPVGTVAFYGPDAKLASKVVVGISPNADAGVTETRTFCNADIDVRSDADVMEQVLSFLKDQRVKSLVMTDGVYGCPHEEGVDYPEGGSCQYCEYWRGRPRDVPVIG